MRFKCVLVLDKGFNQDCVCAWTGMNYKSANLPCLTGILEGRKPLLSANHGELTAQLHSDVKGLTY